ncbi:hypothetical protein HDU84_002936 [Entophlyctis sp. JEL0112]|nr:hypothetical protein HDU84_002936 [Entophlyctis sp. JEL0112]
MKFTEFRASAEPGQSTALSVRRFAEEAFLPVGFPASVSPDYAEYQIFDSLQAFCSNITGRPIVSGLPHHSKLPADCKQWRFYADILNDAARFIEFAAPVFVSKPWFPVSACLATLLKALCGVTGGSTKAALSQHFAITNNMADLHAKEGSQETVVGMIGMIGGAILLRLVGESDNQLTCGKGYFGRTITATARTLHQVVDAWSGGVGDKDSDWESLMKTVGSSSPKHIIALDQKSSKFYRILVALSADAVASDILLAYAHGIFLQKKILKIERLPESGDRSWMRDTVAQANKQFFEGAGKPLIQLLEDAGWIVDDGCPSRIHVEGQSRYKLE